MCLHEINTDNDSHVFCGRRQDYHGTIRRGAGYSTSEEAGNSRHVFRTAFNADTRKYHKRIITHEHFYLQEEFSLMGIHLNTRNPKEPHDYSGHISCTCHSLDEVQNKKHFYDYLFLSPIYNCITKSGVTSGFTAEELRQAGKSKVIDSRVMGFGRHYSRQHTGD